ncbi:MAG: hypothetical protein K0R24_729 [Gammaproteobacteria bacterium]|nr:hypothetical protein [Gammaproteobacteria bacterium]
MFKRKSPLPLLLEAYQLETLLGAQYYCLINAIQSLKTKEKTSALKEDYHRTTLAGLYRLILSYPLQEGRLRETWQVLAECLPPYCFAENENPFARLKAAYEQILKAMAELNRSDWSVRYTALHYLESIRLGYEKAIADFKVALEHPERLQPYQYRASLALLGEGYYHLPVEIARKILCVNEKGMEVKHNEAGSHAVCAAEGVHYKPHLQADAPINPGKEYAVSSLMQLIGGHALAAAPSTLLSVEHIPVVDPEKKRNIGGLIQGGLTVEGICFRDYLKCRLAIQTWQSRLPARALICLLQDNQSGFKAALEIAQKHHPAIFTATERENQSEVLREAFEKLCQGKPDNAQLIDIQESAGRPENNRRNAFRGLFENYLRFGGELIHLQALVGIFYQYPSLMENHSVIDVLQQCKQAKCLFKLFPATSIAQALQLVGELLTEKYLDPEATSALWIGLLLSLPCDAKTDNFILQLDYDEASHQLKACRIVAIDNDLSLKMPFSQNQHNQLCLETKNLLIAIPELTSQPLHPVIRQRLLATSAHSQFFTWLCILAQRDNDYAAWQAQGTVTQSALSAIDIPMRLPEQVWSFVKSQWHTLQELIRANPTITHGECLIGLYPLVAKTYQGLEQISRVPEVLSMETTLYRFFDEGGCCPVERLIPDWPEEAARLQCAKASPLVSVTEQCKRELSQIDWFAIPVEEQWPLVESLSLIPALTLKDWQGASCQDITPCLQTWFRQAVVRGSPLAAYRLLQLGASVSKADESQQTALHHFCLDYLSYPNSEAIALMAEVLLTHHTCQPNQYNARGYTPLLQWINATPDPASLTPAQTQSAFRVLEVLSEHGANLEAKDVAKHETALDKTMREEGAKITWFIALIERGAGIHANGAAIVKFINTLNPVQHPGLPQALSQLAERNLSARWALGQRVWRANPNKDAEIMIRGTDSGEVYLPRPIENRLLTRKHTFDTEGDTTNYGRRVVKAIDYQTANWHVKEHPEMPGIEIAVKFFANLLFGEHTPPNELFSFFDTKGKPYPVLISQTVKGDNLQDVLNQSPAQVASILDQLHPQYLSEQIILAMLIHPEDGKPDNYQLLPMTIKQGEKAIGAYRIVGIDNDHAFVKAVGINEGKRILQVKCVLFCFEMMRKPVPSAVTSRLLALSPVQFLSEWLQHIMDYQTNSLKLFDKKARQHLFKSTANSIKVALRRERERLPVVITIPFRDKAITELWDRFVSLQEQLRKNPLITHLQLLKIITPALGIRYEEAFELFEEPFSVAARFHEIAQTQYSTAIAGRYATLTTSKQALEAMGLSEKEQKTILDEEKGACFTPKAALNQLHRAVEQKAKAEAFVHALEQCKKDIFNEILSEKVKEDIVNQINFEKMLIPGTKKPDLLRQEAILKIILQEKIAFQSLVIQHCAALKDDFLLRLLKNAEGLTKLKLIDCPQITDEIGGYIVKHVPHLVSLSLIRLPNMSGLGKKIKLDQSVEYEPLNLQQLKRINVSENIQLHKVTIQCPNLTHAMVRRNKELTVLALLTENMKALDISYCENFRDRALESTIRICKRLPRLNLQGCSLIQSHMFQWFSENKADSFLAWNLKELQKREAKLKYCLIEQKIDFDERKFDAVEIKIVLSMLAKNKNLREMNFFVLEKEEKVSLDKLFFILSESACLESITVPRYKFNSETALPLFRLLMKNKSLKIFQFELENSIELTNSLIEALQCNASLNKLILNGIDYIDLLKLRNNDDLKHTKTISYSILYKHGQEALEKLEEGLRVGYLQQVNIAIDILLSVLNKDNLSRHNDLSIRSRAAEAFGKRSDNLALHADHLNILINALLAELKNKGEWCGYIHASAAETIGILRDILKAYPHHSSTFSDALISIVKEDYLLQDNRQSLIARASAIESLVKLGYPVKTHSEYLIFVNDLVSALQAQEIIAATSLVKLSETLKDCPENLNSFIDALLSGLEREDLQGFFHATAAESVGMLSEILKTYPGLNYLNETLFSIVKSSTSLFARISAAEALLKLGSRKIYPEPLKNLVRTLLSELKTNDPSNRQKAAQAVDRLGEILKVYPEYLDTFIEALLAALEDKMWAVRSTAAGSLMKLCKMLQVYPVYLNTCIHTLLLRLQEEENSLARIAVASALVKLIEAIKIYPEYLYAFVDPLHSALKDESLSVRVCIADAFSTVLENLMAYRCEKNKLILQSLLCSLESRISGGVESVGVSGKVTQEIASSDEIKDKTQIPLSNAQFGFYQSQASTSSSEADRQQHILFVCDEKSTVQESNVAVSHFF